MRKIICIGRSFGSRGHEIAPEISRKTGLHYYDRELLNKAVEISNIPMEVLEGAEEKPSNPWMFSLIYQGNSTEYYGKPANDVLFELQKKIILEKASKEDCIFIGRCADDILREIPGYKVVSIFVTAPMDYRVAAVMDKYQLTTKQAIAKINKADRARKEYYDFYTGREWGVPSNYDVTLNMESLGKEKVISIISEIYERM